MPPVPPPPPSPPTNCADTAQHKGGSGHHEQISGGKGQDLSISTENDIKPSTTATTSPKATHPKVRFSLDEANSASFTPIKTSSSRPRSWSIGKSTSPSGQLSTVESSSTRTPPNPATYVKPRTRNRGYSLRRTVFSQNLERQDSEHGAAIEMGSSSSSISLQTSPIKSDGADKRSPTITIQEDDVVEEDNPAKSVRLSDPIFDLPLYTKWLKNQRSPVGRSLKRLSRSYSQFKDRLFHGKPIPPSADGRNVRINFDKSVLPIDERTNGPYVGNMICSSKYTALNFIPRQLWAQFGKLANFYFLCVSILQMVPGLSTTGTYTTIIPLLIFVGISMSKEAYDDLRRRRLDKEENERNTRVLGSETFEPTPMQEYKGDAALEKLEISETAWRDEKWQDVRVGDVVLLERDEAVPADIILLCSSDPTNAAYIETKSLDGETNLKSKRPLPAISEICFDEATTARFDAPFVVEDPNLDLYKFEGKVSVNGALHPLTSNEIVYRGSILRNTHHVYGLVVYSGEECRIRMNANKNARVKAPALQAKVNRVVVIVASIVLFMAIVMTVANQIWVGQVQDDAWYLTSASVPFGHILTSFIIMFNTMLPLSLYVSLEIVKLAQIYFMNDIDMYDAETDTPMESRTSAINEELGQVSYIFSDKTGTLTNNSMKFRKISVAGTAWLHDVDFQERVAQGQRKLLHKKRNGKGKSKAQDRRSHGGASVLSKKASVASGEWQPPTKIGASLQCGKTDEMLEYIQHRPHTMFARKAKFFILGLALCHTCVPEKDDDGDVTFQAESPDEIALVTAAQELGYIVSDRQSKTITIKTFLHGDDQAPTYDIYEILDIIEFSSARKRMSIIVRFPDSRVCIFTKGADTTIRHLLRAREMADANAANVERRASVRKSLEVQEALRRLSVQRHRESFKGRRSTGTIPMEPLTGRRSSVSLGRGRSVHESVDAWLTERERDADIAVPRRSATFYSPRLSSHATSPTDPFNRYSLGSDHGTRPSFESSDMEVTIDENIVLNENAVFERCFQHIDDFATEGLRTLLYGYRYVPETEYSAWKEQFKAATTSLVDRQERIEQAANLIEHQLELLGATAIEDKLQDGVPDAIERFRRAGIKMWMLTGDKRETAINIGHSCRLIKDYSTTIVLDHELGDLPTRMTTAVADIHNNRTTHSVLVVDGQTLAVIEVDSALKALFTDLAIAADSVVCCRASPSQKAGLVRTVRNKVKGSVTLAIGDGANDIAMIQEAHVGIGIAGKEGLQAARTSDYSIAQFRFLLKLLLVHGRWNYVRVCKYTLGTFWKEMIFYIVQALYQRWNGYTGTSLYEPWSLSMFNTLFTSLPVIFLGIFEKDLSASTLLAVPELYSIGRLNQGFNIPTYIYWALLGTFESLMVYFMTWSIYGDSRFTNDQGLFAMGTLAFTACVVFISIKLQIIELHNKSVMAGLAIFLSVGGWWLWNLVLSAVYPSSNTTYQVNQALLHRFGQNALWWLLLIAIVSVLVVFEISLKTARVLVRPDDTETFQLYERDLAIKRRFEESAADLLQQGWNRGEKKSSHDIIRDEEQEVEREQLEAQREAEIEAILSRPRTLEADVAPDVGIRRRSSVPLHDEHQGVRVDEVEEPVHSPKRSIDIGELFRSGFGKVKKGNMD